MYKAITLAPEERRFKAMLARQAVERRDLNMWLGRQIRDVNELLDIVVNPPSLPKEAGTVVANVS